MTTTIEKVTSNGLKKIELLERDPSRYMLQAVLAGMYLSIVVLVYWSLLDNLHESPFGKVIASAFFGVGLSIILFTGAELFTSNNMYMAASSFEHRTTWRQAAKLWTACYLGNLAGAIMLAVLLRLAGVLDSLPAEHALYAGALHKAQQAGTVIFFKGVLANWIVCLAVWVALQLKEDIAKIAAMVLIVFIFLYLGFEHSIANMGTFAMSMLGNGGLTASAALRNLVLSTAGNIVGGGAMVGCVYSFLGSTKKSFDIATSGAPIVSSDSVR